MKTVNIPFSKAMAIWTRPSVKIFERIYKNFDLSKFLDFIAIDWVARGNLSLNFDRNMVAGVQSGHIVICARLYKPIMTLWHKNLGSRIFQIMI